MKESVVPRRATGLSGLARIAIFGSLAISLASATSATAAILFEDDFDGDALSSDDWLVIDNGTGARLEVGDGALDLFCGTAPGGGIQIHSKDSFLVGAVPLVFEAIVTDGGVGGIAFGFDAVGGATAAHFTTNTGPSTLGGASNARVGTATGYVNTPIGIDFTLRHLYRIELDSLEARFFVDDQLVATESHVYAGQSVYVLFGNGSTGTDGSMQIELVRVSAVPEPSGLLALSGVASALLARRRARARSGSRAT